MYNLLFFAIIRLTYGYFLTKSAIFRYFGCFERKKRPSKDEDELAKQELEKFQVD